MWCYYPGSYTTLSEGMNELSEYILKKADHKDDAAVSLAYGLYKQVVNEDYTLRRLVAESNPMTLSVNKEDEEENDYKVLDERELMTLSSDDAPQMPLSGKVIIGVCILSLLFISTFTFMVSLYGSDYWTSLIAMTEMRILLSLSGAMAILLPTLIIFKWYNRFRLFKQTLEEADGQMDDICMRMYSVHEL